MHFCCMLSAPNVSMDKCNLSEYALITQFYSFSYY